MLDKVEFDDIVWNGDLNYDPTRTSGFVSTVNRFLSRLGPHEFGIIFQLITVISILISSPPPP